MPTQRNRRRHRRRRRKNIIALTNKLPGFPKTRLVKMRYCDVITLNPLTSGGMSKYQFRANSIFDPDYTGTGHSPLGKDQMAEFYNHYTVISSKITVQGVPNVITNSTPIIYGCYLSDDATIPTTIRNLCEQGLSGWNVASPLRTKNLRITKTFSAKKFFNLQDIKDNQNRVGSSMGSNPHDTAFYNVWYSALDTANEPPPLEALITIEYLVVMNEPRSLAES